MEIWKQVKWYEGHEVSNFGNVRARTRKVWSANKYYRHVEGSMLKPEIHKQGYLRIRLSNGVWRKAELVHRLVAEAFIPNPENKPYVNHKDNNPANNHVDNLEWCTQRENVLHAMSIGRHPIHGLTHNH